MAVVELLFGRKEATKIGRTGAAEDVWELQFDATLSEQQEFTNRVTSFPVESGSQISDHILHEPEELTLEGLISNASLNYLGVIKPNISQGTLLDGTRPSDPVLYAYLKLLEFAWPGYYADVFTTRGLQVDSGVTLQAPQDTPLVDILTEFRLYTSMALQRLTVPRKSDTGDALIFTVSFKKIRQVQTQEVTQNISTTPKGAERADTKAPDKVDAGKQEPEAAPAETWLYDVTH